METELRNLKLKYESQRRELTDAKSVIDKDEEDRRLLQDAVKRKIRRRKEALDAKLEKECLVKALQDMKNNKDDLRRNSNCTLSLSVKVLSNYLHLQTRCNVVTS